jgi:hypothetical protein
MANTLGLIAFSAVIASQFLAAVFAYQYRSGVPATRPAVAPRMAFACRAA